jgi:cytoskeletal protein CcmA (bactofilin family)
MALFGKSEKKPASQTSVKTAAPSVAPVKSGNSAITECMEIIGNVKGCGTVHIDGTVHGDVKTDESIVLGKNGKVNGDIEAKKVVVGGKVTGLIKCETLEIAQGGVVTETVEAKTIICDGTLEGSVNDAETIRITKNGKVETKKMVGGHIIVDGLVEGSIVAKTLLEINENGRVKGEMTVRKIKVNEGGLMLGTMLTYEPGTEVKTMPKKPAADTKPEQTKNEQAQSLKDIVNKNK